MKTNGLIGKKPQMARAAWRCPAFKWSCNAGYLNALMRWHRAASGRKA